MPFSKLKLGVVFIKLSSNCAVFRACADSIIKDVQTNGKNFENYSTIKLLSRFEAVKMKVLGKGSTCTMPKVIIIYLSKFT